MFGTKIPNPMSLCGRLNELTKGDEKLGGNRSSHNQMQLFRDAIDECSLIDLGYSGSKFTWRKHFANGQLIWERLDRALCTNEQLQQFGATRVFISIAIPRTTFLSGLFLMVQIPIPYLDHLSLRRYGYQIRGVAVLWRQCGEIRYIVRLDTK